MGEHNGCIGCEGAASTVDANNSTGRVRRAHWERQEVWQKLDLRGKRSASWPGCEQFTPNNP